MSLDVWLEPPEGQKAFLVNNELLVLSKTDWIDLYDGLKDEYVKIEFTNELYSANITHNLNQMATQAGIYVYLWTPEQVPVKRAEEMIGPLENGLALLRSSPGFYKTFEAANGWGNYGDFLPWVDRYLQACKQFPYASVHASR